MFTLKRNNLLIALYLILFIVSIPVFAKSNRCPYENIKDLACYGKDRDNNKDDDACVLAKKSDIIEMVGGQKNFNKLPVFDADTGSNYKGSIKPSRLPSPIMKMTSASDSSKFAIFLKLQDIKTEIIHSMGIFQSSGGSSWYLTMADDLENPNDYKSQYSKIIYTNTGPLTVQQIKLITRLIKEGVACRIQGFSYDDRCVTTCAKLALEDE